MENVTIADVFLLLTKMAACSRGTFRLGAGEEDRRPVLWQLPFPPPTLVATCHCSTLKVTTINIKKFFTVPDTSELICPWSSLGAEVPQTPWIAPSGKFASIHSTGAHPQTLAAGAAPRFYRQELALEFSMRRLFRNYLVLFAIVLLLIRAVFWACYAAYVVLLCCCYFIRYSLGFSRKLARLTLMRSVNARRWKKDIRFRMIVTSEMFTEGSYARWAVDRSIARMGVYKDYRWSKFVKVLWDSFNSFGENFTIS